MTSQGIHINLSNITAASSSIPADTPILMLNLLRFRTEAKYPSGTDYPSTSGREAYLRGYVPVFFSIAAEVSESIQPFWFGAALAHLVVADGEQWDVAALIRYPSFQAFRDVTESEKYQKEGLPHRLAALEDWRLIVTLEMTTEQVMAG